MVFMQVATVEEVTGRSGPPPWPIPSATA